MTAAAEDSASLGTTGGQDDSAGAAVSGGTAAAVDLAGRGGPDAVSTSASAAEAVSDSRDLLGIKAYVPVLLDVIRTTDRLAFDIYVKQGERGFVPFRFRNTPLQDRDRQQLLVQGVHQVYVDVRHHPNYCQYVEGQLDAIISDASIDIQERARLLYQVSDRLVEEIAAGLTVEHLKRARQLVRVLASHTLHSRTLPEAMARVVAREQHVGAHALHVCSGMLRIGLSMKLAVSELADLALAGILHDAGKSMDVLTCWELPKSTADPRHHAYREHPTLGAQALQMVCAKSSGLIAVAGQHHEALDRSGFPTGLPGESIHLWARICAVVDAYDCLTQAGPNRKPLEPGEALGRIEADSGSKLDPEIVGHLKRLYAAPATRGATGGAAGEVLLDIGQSGPGGAERRQSPRYPFHVAVIVRRGLDRQGRPVGRSSIVVQALDVSRTGIHFISRQPFGVGEVILVDLPTQIGGKGPAQQVRAKIVRCLRWNVAAGYDIGATFIGK